MGFIACPCGTIVKNIHALKSHQGRMAAKGHPCPTNNNFEAPNTIVLEPHLARQPDPVQTAARTPLPVDQSDPPTIQETLPSSPTTETLTNDGQSPPIANPADVTAENAATAPPMGSPPPSGAPAIHPLPQSPLTSSCIPPADSNPEPLFHPHPLPLPRPSLLPVPAITDAEESILLSRFHSLALFPNATRPLQGSVRRAFVKKVTQLSTAYLEDPSSRNLLNLLFLPKQGLFPEGSRTPARKKVERLNRFPFVPWMEPPERRHQDRLLTPAARATKAKNLVEQGKLSRATRALLNQTATAPRNAETLAKLKTLHPEASVSAPFRESQGSLRLRPIDKRSFITAEDLRKMSTEKSPGISGWAAVFIHAAASSDKFVEFMCELTSRIYHGIASGREYLSAALLIPLAKPNGGVRPIAIGEMFYRIAAKSILHSVALSSATDAMQFGAAGRGGVEPVIYRLQQLCDGDFDDGITGVSSLDFSNAFNSLNRFTLASSVYRHCPELYCCTEWAYGHHSSLVVPWDDRVELLSSEEGVRQGDPLGPLLFSIGIRDTLDSLASHLVISRANVPSYLDDIYVMETRDGGSLEAIRDFFAASGTGLSLNFDKSSFTPLSSLRAEGIHVGPRSQLAALGTLIGPLAKRQSFVSQQVDDLEKDLENLAALPRQHALLLLRQCFFPRLRHLLRCMDQTGLANLWSRLDSLLRSSFEAIRNCRQHAPHTPMITSLPVDMGGLGLLSYVECSVHARRAHVSLCRRSWGLDDDGPATSQRELCRQAFSARREQWLLSLRPDEQAVFLDNASPLGNRWIHTIPFFPSLSLPDRAVSAALHYRTLTTGGAADCSACHQRNTIGHDETCLGRKQFRLARHEAVKLLLVNAIRTCPDSQVQVEPTVPGTSDRTDFRWTSPYAPNGSSMEFDVTISTPAAPSALASWRNIADGKGALRQWISELETRKQNRYASAAQTEFCPLVLLAGGTTNRGLTALLSALRLADVNVGHLKCLLSLTLVRLRAMCFRF